MSAPPRGPAPAASQGWSPAAQPAAEAPKKSGVPAWIWVSGAVVGGLVLLFVLIGVMASNMGSAPAPQVQSAATLPQPEPAAPAAAPNYQQQILERLGQVEQAFAAQGFQQISDPVTGQMPQGQTMAHPLTLEQGGEYRIIGVCDNDCGDLDLILYDENNVLISQDQLTDATPVVSVTPAWSGAFAVHAVMHNCTVNPCYYALVLYGRPSQ